MPIDKTKCCRVHTEEKEKTGECCQLTEQDDAEQATYEYTVKLNNIWIMLVKNFMEKNRCKHCNCECHCNVKEHGDMYGLCTCIGCEHDTEECETCQ